MKCMKQLWKYMKHDYGNIRRSEIKNKNINTKMET